MMVLKAGLGLPNDTELIQGLLTKNRIYPIWSYFELRLGRPEDVLEQCNMAIQTYSQKNTEKNLDTDFGNRPTTFLLPHLLLDYSLTKHLDLFPALQ